MSRDLIVALDEGTSNVKAVAIDAGGRVLARASRPLGLITPRAGWVEQDGEALLAGSFAVVREVMEQVGAERVAALAISNQRETAIGWQRDTGRPLSAALSWQCSRSAPFCEQLRRDQQEAAIRAATGLPVAPLFSGSKMRWLLDNTPDGHARAARGEICLGTIDAWLLWRLTGGRQFRCDLSNAARTQLLNLHSLQWDDAMLALFGIPRAALPELMPSAGEFGVTCGVPGVADGIPILAMAGDSHAALYGHGLGRLGGVKATYGTGSSVMAPLGTPDTRITTLATTVAWHDGERAVYALEGNIPHTGDGVAWMLQATGLNRLPEAELAGALQTLPAGIDSTDGVYFVPALTGAARLVERVGRRGDVRPESRQRAGASGAGGAGGDRLSNRRCGGGDAAASGFSSGPADGGRRADPQRLADAISGRPAGLPGGAQQHHRAVGVGGRTAGAPRARLAER